MKEFFFRVASLAFETSVLSELEKSGSRQIGDVVREYLSEQSWKNAKRVARLDIQLIFSFFFFLTGINSNANNVYASSKKKQSNCCQ